MPGYILRLIVVIVRLRPVARGIGVQAASQQEQLGRQRIGHLLGQRQRALDIMRGAGELALQQIDDADVLQRLREDAWVAQCLGYTDHVFEGLAGLAQLPQHTERVAAPHLDLAA